METIKKTLGNLPRPASGEQSISPPPSGGNCLSDCPNCGGSGWTRQDLPITDPNFGKMTLCPNALRRKIAHYGLDASEQDLSWADISENENVIEAVNSVQKTLSDGRGWVYLWGSPGLAKTLILKIAIAEQLRRGLEACYVRMVEIIDNMRQAYDVQEPGEEAERRLNRWADIPILAIDEFDRLRETEYASERRFLLMDRRYEQALRGKSITLMASNANPQTFDSYLSDRIFDGRFQVIHLTGDSMRPVMDWWDH